MKKHNFIRRGLLLVLMIAMLSLPAYAAGTSLKIDAPASLPAVGETFTVKVDISGNPGLCAAQYTLVFDKTVVTCVSASVGDVLKGTLSAANPDAADGAIVAAAATSPAKGDGSIGVFTFKVLKSGETGFTLKDAVFSDANGASISTNVPAADASQKPSDPTKPDQPTTDDLTKPDQPKTDDPAEPSKPADETTTPDATGQTFSDVPKSFWGYESIERAAQLGYVNGVGGGKFEPNRQLTRAEFVTMLYRMAGKPAASTAAAFTDVPQNAWYRDALNWAAEKGYVNGTGANTFSPDGKITRQEVVTILFRYSGSQSGAETMFTATYDSQFTDSGAIAPWAKSAMYWAVYNGVVNGTSQTTVSPTATATRAEVAAIFVRYAK